jgi:hypothetical protein
MPIETKDEPGLRIIYDGTLSEGINLFIFFGLLSVAITIWRISAKDVSQTEKYILLGAWGILPPVWFLVEYFYIYLPYGIKGSFDYFQYGQSVASKVWGAIFALISISLYSSKDK